MSITAEHNAKRAFTYTHTFIALAKKYFKLDASFLIKLNDDELKNLSNLIYEKAKRRLKILMPLYLLGSLALVPVIGIGIGLLHEGLFNKHCAHCFKTYKFVASHKWFWERFAACDLRKNMPLC